MLGEHEAWPPEAETLPPVERETVMARLWGTLARNLVPGNGTRGFFVASAKAMKERLAAALRTKRRATADSTAASSSKTPRREEESPTEDTPPPEIEQQQDSSHRGHSWACSNAELAQRLSKTFGKFNEKTSDRVFAGCVYETGTADELASREAMLDRLCADERVMPDQPSADALKSWASSSMRGSEQQLKCAIGDPGAGLRGRTSCGAAVMTYPRACNRHICIDPEQLLAAPTANSHFQSQHATIARLNGTNTLSLTIAIGLALDAMLDGRDPAWIGVLAPSSPSFPFSSHPPFLVTPHPVFAVDGQFLHDLTTELKDKDGHLIPPTDLCRRECYAQVWSLILALTPRPLHPPPLTLICFHSLLTPRAWPFTRWFFTQIFDRCFKNGQRAFVFVEGRVGREELMQYIKRHRHSVAVWTQASHLFRACFSLCLTCRAP